MNNLSQLVTLLKNDKQIQRFQELEKIIDHNESIRFEYNKLLNLQKIMVKHEFKKSALLTTSTLNYETQLRLVMEFPIIEEYLDLLDMVNNDISLIKSIIEQEIAIDFD